MYDGTDSSKKECALALAECIDGTNQSTYRTIKHRCTQSAIFPVFATVARGRKWASTVQS